MLKTPGIRQLFLLILLFITGVSYAQNIRIEIDPEVVPLNQPLRISIIGENQAIETYKGFPEIDGFVKRGSSSSTSTVINNGSISYEQSISMRYLARKEGTYRIPDFTLTVNGKEYSVQGRTVQVTPEAVASRNKNDPFGSNMIDNFLFPEDNRPIEYIEIDDDAFLAVTPDKREVYQGEGVNVTVAFYRGENSRAPFDFYKHNEQIAAIRKAIRPTNVWEEDFQITNHYPHRVEVNGKRYIQTKLYQATYYPLTLDPIEIPAVNLEMIKYKVARNPRFLARNKQVDYKTFTSRPVSITVKELPPHALKDRVPVGDFRLQERVYEEELSTGVSTYYNFRIVGEGNIQTLFKPEVPETDAFEIFDPVEQRDISRAGDRVSGQATFSYFITPKEPGTYDFGDLFQYIFFNPRTEVYDTLRSEISVSVTGDPIVEKGVEIETTGLFYDRIATTDNNLRSRIGGAWWQLMGNVLILLALVLTGIMVFKK